MKDETKIDRLQDLALEGPQPGEVYRHYKGGLYVVMCRSIMEDSLEPLVVYFSLKKGYCWARTLANWSEMVDGVSRFTFVARKIADLASEEQK